MQAAFSIHVMPSLLAFFGSLAEPARLALMGMGLIFGALLLRRLLIPVQHTLRGPAKVDAQA